MIAVYLYDTCYIYIYNEYTRRYEGGLFVTVCVCDHVALD